MIKTFYRELKRYLNENDFGMALRFVIGLGISVLGIIALGAGCVTVEEPPCNGGDTTVVVTNPPPAPADAGAPDGQVDGQPDPTGPTIPMAAPRVSFASVPTTTLSNGTVVAYRMTITADAAADVQVKKLSFVMSMDTANPDVYVSNPHLRLVGAGSDLPATADPNQVTPSLCGDNVDAPDYPCYRIVFDQPLLIKAGTSVTLDLRATVAGWLTSGDSLTSFYFHDFGRDDAGVLTGTGLDTAIKGGDVDGMLWSNDGVWYYSGYHVVSTPVAQTLTRQ